MTVGELISLLQKYNPDSKLLIHRRFQLHDYHVDYNFLYKPEKYIRPHQDGLIIYEDSDGS